MTTSLNDRLSTAVGDGTTVAFDFDFDLSDETFILVLVDGIEIDQADYTVDIDLQTVTFNTAPASSASIVMLGAGETTQTVDYSRANNSINLEALVNQLDLLARTVQELQTRMAYSIQGDYVNATPKLIGGVAEGKTIIVDADGNFVEGFDGDDIGSAQAAGTAAAASAAAAAASETAAQGYAANAGNAQASNAGLSFTYDSTTTDADPGAGKVRFNNASLASATLAYIDNSDNEGLDVSAYLDTWDDASATDKGQLIVRDVADPTIHYIFAITGTVVDGTGYRKVTINYVSGSGALTDADDVVLIFLRAGDTGAAGAGSGDMLEATYDPASVAEQLVGLTAAQTLTNKTLDGFNVSNADTAIARSGAGAITVDGVAVILADDIGVSVQAYDATLAALAGTGSAANKIPYYTAADTAAELTFKPSAALSTGTTTVPSEYVVKSYVDANLLSPPTSSTFPVNFWGWMYYISATAVGNGGTVAGSSVLSGVGFALDSGSPIGGGGQQAGTWRNVSGITLRAYPGSTTHGYMVRIA